MEYQLHEGIGTDEYGEGYFCCDSGDSFGHVADEDDREDWYAKETGDHLEVLKEAVRRVHNERRNDDGDQGDDDREEAPFSHELPVCFPGPKERFVDVKGEKGG